MKIWLCYFGPYDGSVNEFFIVKFLATSHREFYASQHGSSKICYEIGIVPSVLHDYMLENVLCST